MQRGWAATELSLVILSGADRRIPVFVRNQANTVILPSFHSEPVLSEVKEPPSAPQDDCLTGFHQAIDCLKGFETTSKR